MADVRSMLRAERANRRITHPNASYTSDGKLLCNLCETIVKSAASWGAHLHSSQHALRLSRAQDAATARAPAEAPAGRKRKASTLDSPPGDERKRARSTEVDHANAENDDVRAVKSPEPELPSVGLILSGAEDASPAQIATDALDEDEFAAFERDIAAVDLEQGKALPLRSETTISRAPVSAEEAAALAEGGNASQKGRRDAEIEEDREDAARLMEEEFDEIEGLEVRLRRLQEKRDALRAEGVAAKQSPSVQLSGSVPPEPDLIGDADDDDDDDDDDDGFDDWQFGST